MFWFGVESGIFLTLACEAFLLMVLMVAVSRGRRPPAAGPAVHTGAAPPPSGHPAP